MRQKTPPQLRSYVKYFADQGAIQDPGEKLFIHPKAFLELYRDGMRKPFSVPVGRSALPRQRQAQWRCVYLVDCRKAGVTPQSERPKNPCPSSLKGRHIFLAWGRVEEVPCSTENLVCNYAGMVKTGSSDSGLSRSLSLSLYSSPSLSLSMATPTRIHTP